jgi:hypothetical protein
MGQMASPKMAGCISHPLNEEVFGAPLKRQAWIQGRGASSARPPYLQKIFEIDRDIFKVEEKKLTLNFNVSSSHLVPG